jgi:general secretion pathway protein K
MHRRPDAPSRTAGSAIRATVERGAARGSALVLALWVALLLGVTGTAAVRLTAGAAGASQVEADLARARAAAEGGLWAAAQRIAALQPRDQRPPVLGFEMRIGGALVGVHVADEDGRVDLNAAPEPLLAALFRLAGRPPPEAAVAAARLAMWREASDLGGRRRRLHTVADLDTALGGAPGMGEAVRGLATTYTGRAAPALDAAPATLRAALARQDDAASTVRSGLRTPQPQRSSGAGRRAVWHVTAEARHGAVVARMAAVLDLTPVPGMPGRVLEWRDVAGNL